MARMRFLVPGAWCTDETQRRIAVPPGPVYLPAVTVQSTVEADLISRVKRAGSHLKGAWWSMVGMRFGFTFEMVQPDLRIGNE